jgi:tyrosyl-tRNA synthetase
LKIYTLLTKDAIEAIMHEHQAQPRQRIAQTRLAEAVTELVHGREAMETAKRVTDCLTGRLTLEEVEDVLEALRQEIPAVRVTQGDTIARALVESGLATSNTEARRFIADNAISLNGHKVNREAFEDGDFQNGRLLMRRGKAYKDSALVELEG